MKFTKSPSILAEILLYNTWPFSIAGCLVLFPCNRCIGIDFLSCIRILLGQKWLQPYHQFTPTLVDGFFIILCFGKFNPLCKFLCCDFSILVFINFINNFPVKKSQFWTIYTICITSNTLRAIPDFFQYGSDIHGCYTRYASRQNPWMKVYTKSGNQTIAYTVAILWDNIPTHPKDLNIFNFSKHLKLYLLSEQHSEN